MSSILLPSFSKAFWPRALLLSINFDFQSSKYGDFHTRSKTSFRKTLKYGGNETNQKFTIDINTNVIKKTVNTSVLPPPRTQNDRVLGGGRTKSSGGGQNYFFENPI